MMELLSPAGSFDAARAAVASGADAIYMGGPYFSARAYADSSKEGKDTEIVNGDPERDPLLKSIRHCHLFGVKVYMTLNTLMKDQEFNGLKEYLDPYTKAGVDAFIVQDIGLMGWLRKQYPETALHVSTQAAVTGPRYAKKLKEFGAVRVVPARECSLEELKSIADTGIEVEAFIHGALCYSYSGQCLMSSFIGCRSGNRGRCAGTCRLPVEVFDDRMRRIGEEDENYLLSMRDLCTLNRLKDMEEAGVCSLKIEGRMKSPIYVAGVTSVYRKWLDAMAKGEPVRNPENDFRKLAEIFDRGGFTEDYLDGKNGRNSLTLKEKQEMRIPDQVMVRELTDRYLKDDSKIAIRMKGRFINGEEAVLELETLDGPANVIVTGEPVQTASRKPVTKEEIMSKLNAFGNTHFELKESDLTVDDNIFIPVGSIKELRRRACEELEKCILKSFG